MITIISGFIVVFVVILQLFIPHLIPSIFTTIVRPFWRMEFSIASGSLDSPSVLLAENEALKIKLQTMIADNASVGGIQAENEELLSLLGRSSNAIDLTSTSSVLTSFSTSTTSFDIASLAGITNNSRILAAVLVRPPFAPYDEFVVDVGSNRGIVAGAKVFAPGGILIGTTTDVLGETSKVSLFSSPGETYPVLIGSQHVPTTAIGRGGGQYEAQIPQATQIAIGDIVYDASLGDGVFGTVTQVLNNPANPFETILFAPVINIFQLRWVLIDTGIYNSNYIQTSMVLKPNVSSTASHSSTTKIKK